MSRFKKFSITESSLTCTIKYTRKCIEKTFIPLVREIAEDFQNSGDQRYILCIAGPPGCGKSSIAKLFQILLENRGIETRVLPLDGFHLKSSELKKKSTLVDGLELDLYSIKGAKETYDTGKLFDFMKKLSQGNTFFWPVYSRTTHDPVDKGVHICDNRCIYIIEGNYLLLSEHPWNLLRQYFNKRIFIASQESILRLRVIRRKRKGGISPKEARCHYKKSDRRNIREVLDNSDGYDWLITQRRRYRYDLSII